MSSNEWLVTEVMTKERRQVRISAGAYRSLKVWRKAVEMVVSVYELSEQFPDEERFGLVSQLRRSAVSIPSNIAEGSNRGSTKDFAQFLQIAYGSGAELETQLEIAYRLPKTSKLDYTVVEEQLTEVMKMLNSLIRSTRGGS